MHYICVASVIAFAFAFACFGGVSSRGVLSMSRSVCAARVLCFHCVAFALDGYADAGSRADAARKAEEQRISNLMGSMDSLDDDGGNVSTRVAGALVTKQSDEIRQAADEYASKETERQQGGRGAEDAHRRTLAALRKRIAGLEEYVLWT